MYTGTPGTPLTGPMRGQGLSPLLLRGLRVAQTVCCGARVHVNQLQVPSTAALNPPPTAGRASSVGCSHCRCVSSPTRSLMCGSRCEGDMMWTQASLQDLRSLWGRFGATDITTGRAPMCMRGFRLTIHTRCLLLPSLVLSVALRCPCAVVPRLCGQCGAVGEPPLVGAWLQPHHV
jgi:hypothetical protein